MKLTIDRSIWLRGEGSIASFLLRQSDNKQCCIGILLEANGVKRDKLMGVSAVKNENNIPCVIPPDNLNWLNEDQVNEFYSINDSKAYDDTFREQKLTEMFATHGIEVEFIN